MPAPPGEKRAPRRPARRSEGIPEIAKAIPAGGTSEVVKHVAHVNDVVDLRYVTDVGTGLPVPIARQGDGTAPLPCLNSNNSTLKGVAIACNSLTGGHRRTAFGLVENVAYLAEKYGIERLGFLTLTFADHVVCAREAQRRFNSLRTHVLDVRYLDWIAVLERQKGVRSNGRIHFHLLVAMPIDVRTGFDFEAVSKRVYASVNQGLRSEWAFWRRTAPAYRFGRTELMPVKSTAEGISKYVGKYIEKHIGARIEADRGVRLVRYSKGARRVGTRFAWVSPRARLWREQVAAFAAENGCADEADLSKKFGPRWAYNNREYIMDIPARSEESADLQAVSHAQLVSQIAEVSGESIEDVCAVMYRRSDGERRARVSIRRILTTPGCPDVERRVPPEVFTFKNVQGGDDVERWDLL